MIEAVQRWLSEIRRPVVIAVGAGTAVPSVRHFSHRLIQEFGGRLVRINPHDHRPPTSHDVGIALGALKALRAIEAVIESR